MKTQSESSLLSNFRSQRGERILEVDGTLTTQPVLEHVGISTWPGMRGSLMVDGDDQVGVMFIYLLVKSHVFAFLYSYITDLTLLMQED